MEMRFFENFPPGVASYGILWNPRYLSLNLMKISAYGVSELAISLSINASRVIAWIFSLNPSLSSSVMDSTSFVVEG